MTSQFDIFNDMEKDFQRNYSIGYTKEDEINGIEKGIDITDIKDLQPIKTSDAQLDENGEEVVNETLDKTSDDPIIKDETIEEEKNSNEIKNFFVKS